MFTDREVLMASKAEELQAMREYESTWDGKSEQMLFPSWKEGDWYLADVHQCKLNHVICTDEGIGCVVHSDDVNWRYPDHSCGKWAHNSYHWLPRLDQLFDMLQSDRLSKMNGMMQLYYIAHDFIDYVAKPGECESYKTIYQGVLGIVMRRKYKKVWNDDMKEWVGQQPTAEAGGLAIVPPDEREKEK